MTRDQPIDATGATRLVVAALLCAVAISALDPTVATAKPPANRDGGAYCLINNDREIGGVLMDSDAHKCCYWERTRRGEALRVCLQCDEHWKNCEETLESPATRLPDASTGTTTRTAPSGGTLPGATTTTPGIELRLQNQR